MKKLIAVFISLLMISSTLEASAQVDDYCELLNKLASSAMGMRQSGIPMETLLQVTSDDDEQEEIVRKAYTVKQYRDPGDQEAVADAYGVYVYDVCQATVGKKVRSLDLLTKDLPDFAKRLTFHDTRHQSGPID